MSDKRIYKYELEITDIQKIDIPFYAEILSAKEQDGKLFILALVETTNTKDQVEFLVVGTGNPLPDISQYYFLDTVVMSYGLVWHIFHK